MRPKPTQKPTPQRIDPHEIRMDLETQARSETGADTVQEYAELMENGVTFPPLSVFFDVETQEYILADGFHRLFAHLRARPNDPVEIEQYLGDASDAQWFAICANQSHGRRRSNEDKRNAVTLALLHKNGYGKSNNQIAQSVGVTHTMVNKVRKEMEMEGRLETVSSRTGSDGRTYNTANIGKGAEIPLLCQNCGHFKEPRCLMDGDNHLADEPGCEDFFVAASPLPHRDEGVAFTSEDDPNVAKNVKRRLSRRHKGDYVRVPLDRTNPDRGAVEIRCFLGESYLAALAQSALKILKED